MTGLSETLPWASRATLSLAESERDLVVRARAGDETAFAQLVHHYTPKLYRVVRRMTADDMLAEDILQETFLRFWLALPRYRNDGPLFPYLVTIAANLARDRWRRDRRWHDQNPDEVPAFQADLQPTPEEWMERQEVLEALARAVEHLPPIYRAVIALRYDAGLTYEEIAAVLDLPLNTVRVRLHRAKARLRTLLEEQMK